MDKRTTRTRSRSRTVTSCCCCCGCGCSQKQQPPSNNWASSLRAKSVIQKMSYKMLQPVTIIQSKQQQSRKSLKRPPLGGTGQLVAKMTTMMVCWTVLLTVYTSCQLVASVGVAPTIDYSHNMRVLKLPKSTKPGEIIYRLKGSDGDLNSHLHFGVLGISGRALLDIVQVPGSWKEADVYLRTRLDNPELTVTNDGLDSSASTINGNLHDDNLSTSTKLYSAVVNLTIFVADATNKTTQVDSTILVTNDDHLLDDATPTDDVGPSLDGIGSSSSGYDSNASSNDPTEQQRYQLQAGASSTNYHSHQANGSALILKLPTLPTMARVNSNQLSPFIRPRHVFGVPENGQPGESIGFLTVRESDKSDLPVRFELRGRGSEHFGIRYVFGPRGQSRAELVLSQPVDYEKQNLFQLKVLALNAWTNVKYDTRNVATLDIVIAVGDVQDTPPKFRQLPHSLRLANNLRPGDLVGRVEAEDGDYADQRPIGYALDAGSPLSNYFTIDKQSGEIRLLRPLQELSLNQHSLSLGGSDQTQTSGGSLLQLTVYASELPDATSYDHLWPPMFARAELPLQFVDSINEPPQFIGGWITESNNLGSGLTVPTLRAFIREFTNERSDLRNEDAGRDSAEVSSSSSMDNYLGPQLVQWYTNKNQSAASTADLGSSSQDSMIAQLHQQLLKASRGRPMVVDHGQGLNGTFELLLEGPDAHLFELEPSYPVNKQTLFNLFVSANANRSLFDFDAIASRSGGSTSSTRTTTSEPPARAFHVELVARDFGSPHRQTSRLKCLIDLVDINDNAPQFDLDLYTFSIFENAQLGQILGSIRARDMDRLTGVAGVLSGQYQRVRYTTLSGRDSHLFRLDQESGLITLEGPLDREKQDHYLLLAEARDSSGQAANYTKILINVLDVNDNAPVFSQSHYDAVLLADGTFYQPLVVSANDADEPSSANSQVAYEIIAGNQNEQFAIDSLSGAIYPTGGDGSTPSTTPTRPIQLPSILSEPILPFIGARDQQNNKPDQHGKILPSPNAHGHEIEETTVPTGHNQRQPNSPLRLNWPRSVPISGSPTTPPVMPVTTAPEVARSGRSNKHDNTFSSLDPMMQLESLRAEASQDRQHHVRAAASVAPTSSPPSAGQLDPKHTQTAQSQRGFHSTDRDIREHLNPPHHHHHQQQQQHFDASKVPPITTLVVRAHDFGIPLRSATCKVNIYNQALLSRSLSVILNGTAEQLEQRRELIERSFGALTGSRAQIESIDALTDSSSISVARLKLAIPAGHSLIDLTDLSALMTAIDYKLPPATNCPTQQQNLDQFRHPIHYITTGDRIYPIHHASITNNISATVPPLGGSASGATSGGGSTTTTAIFTDIQSFDHANSMLERKLLFYIIIVGICILALLVIWMIYFCCREDQRDEQQKRTKKVESVETLTKRHHRSRKPPGSLDDSELSRESDLATTNGGGIGKGALQKGRHYKSKNTSSSRTHLIDEQQPMARSASQVNLDEQQQTNKTSATQAKTAMTEHPIGNNLLKQQQSKQLSIPSNIKPEHYSMYNGQVWFEQGGLVRQPNGTGGGTGGLAGQRGLAGISERRASSAPSAGGHSLDSSLHAIIQRNGRSSAFSPANSGLATPQRGQFFPNTLGYAENLATIATPSGAAYIYPTGGGGPRQRQFLGRRTLAKSRGRVVPMTMIDSNGARDYTNDAFEPDLEAGPGGLVMVPFVSSGSTQQRHSSHARDAQRRSRGHKSKSQSTSSSSHSDSTRTLDEEDELDHESVLLDSDQELLGFDSTGTPIIATRTRHKPQTDTSLLLAPETGAPTSRTSASSPAATVINMSQSREPHKRIEVKTDERPTTTNCAQLVTTTKGNREEPDGDRGGELKWTTEAGAVGAKLKEELARPGDEARKKSSDDIKRAAADKGTPPSSGGNKDTKTTTEDSSAKKSMDLMSELNERLSSANKQRALRRQSADDESTSRQPTKQVTDQKTLAGKGTNGEQSAPSTITAIKQLAVSTGDSSAAAKPTSTTTNEDSAESKRRQAFAGRRESKTMSCQSQSTISDGTTIAGDQDNRLEGMKNAELLEKQSIFALTYSGLATDKPPS